MKIILAIIVVALVLVFWWKHGLSLNSFNPKCIWVKGDRGGAWECFYTVEDAKKRKDFLDGFSK